MSISGLWLSCCWHQRCPTALQLKTCTQTLPLPKLDPPLLTPRTVQYSLHPENEGMCMIIAQQVILYREAEEFILSITNPNGQIWLIKECASNRTFIHCSLITDKWDIKQLVFDSLKWVKNILGQSHKSKYKSMCLPLNLRNNIFHGSKDSRGKNTRCYIEAIWNRSRKNNNSSQYEDGFWKMPATRHKIIQIYRSLPLHSFFLEGKIISFV